MSGAGSSASIELMSQPSGGILHYVFGYGVFLLAAAVLVTMLHLRRRYHLIQINSMPDALVFAALGPRLLGGLAFYSICTSACPSSLQRSMGLPLAIQQSACWRSRSRRASDSPTLPSRAPIR